VSTERRREANNNELNVKSLPRGPAGFDQVWFHLNQIQATLLIPRRASPVYLTQSIHTTSKLTGKLVIYMSGATDQHGTDE